MNSGISEALDAQITIIRLQTDIIDRLVKELLQYRMIEEEELQMITEAVKLQRDAYEKGILTR